MQSQDGNSDLPDGSPMMSAAAAAAKSLQSCLTLCDPIDGSPPGSQARILEWVAIPFSRGSTQPQGLNLDLLLCRQTLYQLSRQGCYKKIKKKVFIS